MDEVSSNWNPHEDRKLMMLVDAHKVENIDIIHKVLNEFIDEKRKSTDSLQESWLDKSKVECMDRWLKLRNSTGDGTVKQIKGNWTPEEDMILRKKVSELGLKKWKEVATFLPGRIGK